ncbi:deoxyribodipyrimidine photo-lyase [Candidatus Caldatribacterium sp. SIUC1]|uniref:deoxyribodipyrimidine photo-lyase n=1 Tax=Candidatus Caldatribacterium sp. SIUC1 TaxID=3418365 RepID=UPI003F68D4CE
MERRRVRPVKEGKRGRGPVLYWMQREQRVRENWALYFASVLARESDVPLYVCFNLVPDFLGALPRAYLFMLEGLREVEGELAELHIPFVLLRGQPKDTIPDLARDLEASVVVTDFNPLNIVRAWKKEVLQRLTATVFEVDARNIVPVWVTSSKKEYGAFTIRRKIHRHLPECLGEFPKLGKQPYLGRTHRTCDWEKLFAELFPEHPKLPCTPGYAAGMRALREFLEERLPHYAKQRNDPTVLATSLLSPYLHFGQISAQKVALEALKFREKYPESVDAFLEQLIVRRELAENFCTYEEHYDTPSGFPRWAQETLKAHRNDHRPYLYTLEELEHAKTHDPLWNAAQRELLLAGRIHNYVRMYWAKKILEWSENEEEALRRAIDLNDRYALDGRDPNGYTGIAWAIGGVHDRPFPERRIFGKIRSMTLEQCARKFSVERYIARVEELSKDS